ncbi:MAG TPA: hypothetical protein VFR49_11325, partial [Solirubrobacteraceae bacterium]|nr:hypothetical protein [Solirubrobacteraceae bacterium]
SAEPAAAAARALRAKRARVVAAAWPALTGELGREFPTRFDAYARAGAGPPPDGGGLADGLGFLETLDRRPSDAVRVEAAFVRALLARRCSLRLLRLAEPRRLLVVGRAGRGRPRHFTVPL